MKKLTKKQSRWLSLIPIARGSHDEKQREYCVMEAVAYIAGEEHTDAPKCACPYLTDLLIDWNDALATDKERNRLLKPLIPNIVGTKGKPAVSVKREILARNWLLRTYLPYLVRVSETGEIVAKSLEKLPVVRSQLDFEERSESISGIARAYFAYFSDLDLFVNPPLGLVESHLDHISVQTGLSALLETSYKLGQISSVSGVSYNDAISSCLVRYFNNQSLDPAKRKGWPKKVGAFSDEPSEFLGKVFKPVIDKSTALFSQLVLDMCKVK